jgi:hypothetical protein
MSDKGRAQVEIAKADGTGAHRVPLGFWDEKWEAHRGEDWHDALFGAFKTSMTALQRHQESDSRAALHKSGGPAPADPKQEARLLDHEMSTLEALNSNLEKITTGLASRRNTLSPFAAPIDKTDANTAAIRTELRTYLRNLPPLERLEALRGTDEATASAILSAPPHLSGISPDQHAAFYEARLRLRHPEKLASLDAAQQATKLVKRTLDAARTSTRERYLPLLPPAEVEVKPLGPAWVP